MKIKNDIDLDILLTYGFEKIDKTDVNDWDDLVISGYDYLYLIGYSRRGQSYCILINSQNRILNIYATIPDGSGGSTILDDIIIKLFTNNLLE